MIPDEGRITANIERDVTAKVSIEEPRRFFLY
jgi:hypothetical protein